MSKFITLSTAALACSVALSGVLGLVTPTGPAANVLLPSGEEIVQHINARDEGQTASSTLLMELIDRRGEKLVRKTRTFRKYYAAEKRTAIFYVLPKNVEGTAFLTFHYLEEKRDDVQWLYLPSLRKVRRISAADRGEAFLGTDFTYDDMKRESKVSLTDYAWKTLSEDSIDGHRCYMLEGIPVNRDIAKELGYGRVVSWVDTEIWMVRKTDFWDVRGEPLKSSFVRDIRPVQGIWTAHELEAHNHKTGHHTVFTFSDVDYGSKIDDDLFTERTLLRGL
jgi:outer membrane lipoprotein-sorting protein